MTKAVTLPKMVSILKIYADFNVVNKKYNQKCPTLTFVTLYVLLNLRVAFRTFGERWLRRWLLLTLQRVYMKEYRVLF